MRSHRLVPLFLVALAAIGSSQSYVAQEVSVGGYANTISGGTIGGSFGNRAAMWTSTGMVDAHPSGYSFSAILGSAEGYSVGYAGNASLSQAPFVWLGMNASTLPVPFAYVIGRAVATDGVQAVGYATEGDPERGLGAQHAILWNLVTGTSEDLGKGNTLNGVGGGVQVGTRLGSKGTVAYLWRGTASSGESLHVRGVDVSVACATDGSIQVGYLGIDVRVRNEAKPRTIRFYSAGIWTGNASSFTYLPSPYRHSFALGIHGDTIIGYGNTSDPIGTPRDSHAVAWVGPEQSFVDLHALLPAEMRTSRATSVDALGNIVGYGVTSTGILKSFVWLRQ